MQLLWHYLHFSVLPSTNRIAQETRQRRLPSFKPFIHDSRSLVKHYASNEKVSPNKYDGNGATCKLHNRARIISMHKTKQKQRQEEPVIHHRLCCGNPIALQRAPKDSVDLRCALRTSKFSLHNIFRRAALCIYGK
jgi:Tfp pilus assembly protein PilV